MNIGDPVYPCQVMSYGYSSIVIFKFEAFLKTFTTADITAGCCGTHDVVSLIG